MNPSDDDNPHQTVPASPDRRVGWNFKVFACALVITFVLQNIFLPCFCSLGTAKMRLAFIFDGLVIVRMLIAWAIREEGQGCTFYLVLIYTSPLWIKGLFWVFAGDFH